MCLVPWRGDGESCEDVKKGSHSPPALRRSSCSLRLSLSLSLSLSACDFWTMAEKEKKNDVCYAGPGDVECDFCTGRKRKARESCLMCLASYCKTHVKSHYQSPAFKKHKLVTASSRLQEKICSKHDKLMEIYCRTDQCCICYMCMMDEHKGHDTTEAEEVRTEKRGELEEVQRRSQQRIQRKEKQLQEMKEAVNTFKRSAQAAVEDSERVFTELIRSIEKECSKVTEQIRAQEKAQLSGAEEHLKKLEEEISDLKKRRTELEQLSHSDDHISFLQTLQSLGAESENSHSAPQSLRLAPLIFEDVRKSLGELKGRLEESCKEGFGKIRIPNSMKQEEHRAEADWSRGRERSSAQRKIAIRVRTVVPSEPKTREDFLLHYCPLTLDPNTVHHKLLLSEYNRVVTWRGGVRTYPEHPERFNRWPQVLCGESICGRCYWEVEWDNGGWGVSISVSYKGIERKGDSDECAFGGNAQSWSLLCSSLLSFWHNNVETKLSGPSSNRIGVYVDHDAGILSFYGVSDTMTLLHSVHTTFTQPLYAGFWLKKGQLRLCDPDVSDSEHRDEK
ncbi:tripartite motif-containing protein 16-like isoform X1 [Hoplias malabaricus]|uniref:tripartite motif-containing protein 16-like isoform X1 n=2 Tax=Hoplias malabaricus TaxID=27720 RepID=UPI0034628BAD